MTRYALARLVEVLFGVDGENRGQETHLYRSAFAMLRRDKQMNILSPLFRLGFATRVLAIGMVIGIVTMSLPSTGFGETVEIPALFDMGTERSPLEEGFVRATAADQYDAAKGYGFLSAGHRSFQLDPPTEWKSSQLPLDEHFVEHGTPLMIDGVRDTADIGFRVDVAPGTYRVTVSMGDLLDAMGSVSLFANGELVEGNLAFHHGLYRYVSDRKREHRGSLGVTGFYDRIRFTVEASDGVIEILAKGDQSEYDRLYEIEEERGGPPGRLWFQYDAWHDKVPPFVDIGEVFVDIPLLGVEVREYFEPPVKAAELGRLEYSGTCKMVKAGVAAFNKGDFDGALTALWSQPTPSVLIYWGDDSLGAALLCLHVAGWADYEGELAAAQFARSLLKKTIADDPGNTVALEAMETVEVFLKAMDRHVNRGGPGERNHFIQNMRAYNLFSLMQPDDPLYWKSCLHAGRIGYMLDPMHREVSAGSGYRLMEAIYEKFPENRWAKYYVTCKYDNESEPWKVPDYSKQAEGAPEWAARLYQVYNIHLDLAEWWFTNKQREDGSIGGGWGDDVESAGWLSMFAILSEGSSPTNIQGLSNLVHGVFASGDIDEETGFIYMTTDFEHATEWTGDTLPLAMAAEFGNPLWIERAFGSARCMRDLWTGINPKGHRHFRNMYIGGMAMGRDPQFAHDKRMAWRGVYPIERIYWYNQHPAIGKLLLEWSDAWYEDSMSEARGKPKGFIPGIMAYENCLPGAPRSEDWHYMFGGQAYGMNIVLLGYEITGDEKYIEPLRLQAAAYHEIGDDVVPKKDKNNRGAPHHLKKVLKDVVDTLDRLDPPKDGNFKPYFTYDEIADEIEGDKEELRDRWPMWTTEASATDRVGSYKLMEIPLRILGGGGLGKSGAVYSHSVTFQGIERDFASMVTGNYLHRLSLALYVFRDGPIDMAIRPWDLQIGGTYKLTVALDEDEDGRPDGPGFTSMYELTTRGRPCSFSIEGRKTYIITLELVGEIGEPEPTPDLSLWEGDIELVKQWHGNYVTVRIHNTGTADVDEVDVVLYEETPEGRVEIGRSLISHLGWPRDLRPETIKLGWRYEAKTPEVTFTAVVDPDDEVREIVESNNSATRTLVFEKE